MRNRIRPSKFLITFTSIFEIDNTSEIISKLYGKSMGLYFNIYGKNYLYFTTILRQYLFRLCLSHMYFDVSRWELKLELLSRQAGCSTAGHVTPIYA